MSGWVIAMLVLPAVAMVAAAALAVIGDRIYRTWQARKWKL